MERQIGKLQHCRFDRTPRFPGEKREEQDGEEDEEDERKKKLPFAERGGAGAADWRSFVFGDVGAEQQGRIVSI